MNFSWLMDEETMTHPYNGIVFSNRKEKYRDTHKKSTDIHNNMDKSQIKESVKETDSKGYRL